MLDTRDDVDALLRVLEGLTQELTVQREHINGLCQLSDEIGGVDPLPVDDLETQLERQMQETNATMELLKITETEMENVMQLLRKCSRARTVESLTLHKRCADELDRWTTRTNAKYLEQVQLRREVDEVDRKLGKLAAYLS